MNTVEDLFAGSVLLLQSAWHPVLAADWSGAAAVVSFAVLLRLVLLPAAVWQARQQRAAAAVAPQVAAARQRHAGDVRAMMQEVAAINRHGGVRAWPQLLIGGAQAALGITVFRLFTGHANEVTHLTLAGTALGAHLGPDTALVFAVVVAAGAVCSLAASVIGLFRTGWNADARGRLVQKAMFLLPLAGAVSAIFMPLGAVLYVAAQALFSPVQALVMASAVPVPASALAHPVGRRARRRRAGWEAQTQARRKALAPVPGKRASRK